MPGIYLEPIGLVYGAVAKEAIAEGAALPLAGGPVAFGAVRLWEGEPGSVKHAIARVSFIREIVEPRIKELLDRITARRCAIAGVSLDAPRIMGVLNVTPDSFSDGGAYLDRGAAIEHAKKLAREGASFVDIGGESTSPGSDPTALDEELRRVLPVIGELRSAGVPLSIDTRKPEVAREAAKHGANLWNDVSALTFSAESLSMAARLKLPVVLMHAKGEPKTMQERPHYENVVTEVYDHLEARIKAASDAGLSLKNIIADPGIGFGKKADHSFALLATISIFHGLGVPLLTGTSRKSFMRGITRADAPAQRVHASVATAIAAVAEGVQIVRVHDVKETKQALAMWQAVKNFHGHRGDELNWRSGS